MTTNPSFFNNIGNITIEGGSFNMTNVTYIQPIAVNTLNQSSPLTTNEGGHFILDRVCQLLNTPHITKREVEDIIVLVGVPSFMTSIFPTLPLGLRFIASCFIIKIFMDLLSSRPSELVKVMDAMNNYHDFPLAACKNRAAFHAEFFKRSRNQPGFMFIKSGWYDIEYNNRILQSDDWKTVKPFTVLLVDFVMIQQQKRNVKCPWCKADNPLPSSSDQSTDGLCSCSGCGRDCSLMWLMQSETSISSAFPSSSPVSMKRNVELPDLVAPKDSTIPGEIRRIRVKLVLGGDDPTLPTLTVDFLMTLFPRHGLTALPYSRSVTINGPNVNHGIVLHVPGSMKTLYVDGKTAQRDQIVALLDLADEQLGCESLVIVLERSSPHLAAALHSLMYVGGTVSTKPLFPTDPAYVLVSLEI